MQPPCVNSSQSTPLNKCVFNPKDFIKNRQQLQKYECKICGQLSTIITRCTTPTCQCCLCNQCAIDQKTKNNKCPYRCSVGPLSLQFIYPPMEYQCPFTYPKYTLCYVPIKTDKQFLQHHKKCEYISQGQKEQQKRRQTFLCHKNHQLEIFHHIFDQIIKRRQCASCKQYRISRVMCLKCQQFYCHLCRPLPIFIEDKLVNKSQTRTKTNNQMQVQEVEPTVHKRLRCPLGHQFKKANIKSLSYRCDICELNPAMYDKDSYDDYLCNIDICEICIDKYGKFTSTDRHLQGYAENIHNYCSLVGQQQVVNRFSLNQSKDQKDYQKISQWPSQKEEERERKREREREREREQHRLVILKQEQYQECGWCNKYRQCYKKCMKCNIYYCMRCRALNVLQDNTCQQGHQFGVVNLQKQEVMNQQYDGTEATQSSDWPTSGNKLQSSYNKLKNKVTHCYSCRIEVGSVQNIKFYRDNVCNIVLCHACDRKAMDYSYSVLELPLCMKLRKCQFGGHIITYTTRNRDYVGNCSLCSNSKVIKFTCIFCEKGKRFCCACYPTQQPLKCYCQKYLKQKIINQNESMGTNNRLMCLVCDELQHKQIYECRPCDYTICKACVTARFSQNSPQKQDMDLKQRKFRI